MQRISLMRFPSRWRALGLPNRFLHVVGKRALIARPAAVADGFTGLVDSYAAVCRIIDVEFEPPMAVHLVFDVSPSIDHMPASARVDLARSSDEWEVWPGCHDPDCDCDPFYDEPFYVNLVFVD